MHFTSDGVAVEPLMLEADTIERLERNILLFYIGEARESAKMLSLQNHSVLNGEPTVINSLHAIKAMAVQTRRCLERGRLEEFGELLHASWQNKKRLASGISNQRIDDWYELARSKGAMGGKITGAGGGGFLMFYCPPQHGADVTTALESAGLRRMDFCIDFDGAKVLVNNALPFGVSGYA
jgi:D-glycero-alpha-D-manno-heptose-7-phosphate kinase